MILPKDNTLFLQVSPSNIFTYALGTNSLLYVETHTISETNNVSLLISQIVSRLPSELKDTISSAHILYNTLSSLFFPKDLFEEDHAKELLSYNSLLENKKEIFIDYLPDDQSMVNIYQTNFYGLDKAFSSHFKEVSCEHYTTMLWAKIEDYISQDLHNSGYRIFIDTTIKGFFRLIATKDDKLLIHNVFEYKDKASFAYYILYVFKIFGIDSEIVTVYEIKTFSDRQSDEVYQLKNYGIKTGVINITKHLYKEIEDTESVFGLILA